MRRNLLFILVSLGSLLGLQNPSSAADQTIPSAAEQPNVILMMADDLGFADLGCYGSKSIRTPILDQLANDGVRLTSFYAGCTVCTPSRMALMTGAYPLRTGWAGGVIGHRIRPEHGLDSKALTIAEIFQSASYSTGISGKWHLGDAASMLPNNQGFESSYYITKSNNQTRKLYRDGRLVENPFENRLLTQQFTAEAIRFITKNRKRPFFLYLPFTAPHFPAEAHPAWKGKSKLGAYGDVVEELDSRIGEILSCLKKHQLDSKTIVLFISDNGTEPGQKKWSRTQPYRGLKWSSLEGGNRVPCIVKFPGVIPAGIVDKQITGAIDILPTLASACGVDLTQISKPYQWDGVNVWNSWTLDTSKHARKSLLYFHGWGTLQAIRVGEWKLYLDQVKEIKATDQGPVLIHLESDPAEVKDLSRLYPQRVNSMQRLAKKLLADIEADRIPLGGTKEKHDLEKSKGKWLND